MIWTNDKNLVIQASSVLSLYAMGNALLSVAAFPYYLQYAKGDLYLHLYGNVIFLVLLVPCIIWAANSFGMTGAGWAWVLVNFIYILCWIPIVHKRFIENIHKDWILYDVFSPFAISGIAVYFSTLIIELNGSRVFQSATILTIGIIVVGVNTLISIGLKQNYKHTSLTNE